MILAAGVEEFQNKNSAWLRRNIPLIRRARSSPFWERNSLVIDSSWEHGFGPLVERLVDLDYRLAHWPEKPGEFTIRGGTLIIFPIAESRLSRLDFFGNKLESIEKLATRAKPYDLRKPASRKLFPYLGNGDYVVHENHGIGIWKGIRKHNSKDYFMIEYRGPRRDAPDTLLVPVEEERRISPYIGFRTPTISRLGTPLWKRTIRRTKEEALAFARRLLELHAERSLATREPNMPFSEIEEKLASSFPHPETESQLRAINEITSDLESNSPMDRLLLGDVGFGKTEVALRASLRVASNGKQVAVLAPTTLLADQHFEVWQRRLDNLPVRVARLSRLETKKDVGLTLKGIQKGSIDIAVGTHRLLSRDVNWKRLGLLIIDEEQRFGVRAKEHLKHLKKDIDVLTLSATPLPRTLSLALSQLKRMSALDDAPVGRRAPQTFVLPYKEQILKDALLEELGRNGQIYFLEARIRRIPRTLELLKKIIPSRKIGYIHGKLPDKILVETMEKFRRGEIEVLVSTTIIENGIDLSEVNTLVVSDATLFGIGQLHQLRGRVGRGTKEAFAYFFYQPGGLTPKASERLDVLSKTQFLGAGTVIAERDLEMRGAGNILGKEQSGAARLVGLNLYSQFLAEAIEKLRHY